MRSRPFTAVAAAVTVAVLAVTGLSGCTSKAGVAATVGDTKISETAFDGYLRTGGPATSSAAPTATSTTAAASNAKPTVLNTLIREQVFERVLRANGGVPSDKELAALHDQALQTQFPSTDPASADADFASGLDSIGATSRFESIFFRSIELEQALINRLDTDPLTGISAALDQYVQQNQVVATDADKQTFLSSLGTTPAAIAKSIAEQDPQQQSGLAKALLAALAGGYLKDISDAAAKLDAKVTVNSRYGAWDATSLSLTGATGPGYLVPASTSAAPASSDAGS